MSVPANYTVSLRRLTRPPLGCADGRIAGADQTTDDTAKSSGRRDDDSTHIPSDTSLEAAVESNEEGRRGDYNSCAEQKPSRNVQERMTAGNQPLKGRPT